MNGDLQQLMTHINNLHSEQMKELGLLRADFSGHKGIVDTKIEAIERTQTSQAHKQWIHSVIVVPTLAALHALGTHFGIKL